MQKTIEIKTFGNGDKLTCKPAKGGIGTLEINGNWADYRPLIEPKKHSSGAMIAAVLICKKQQYALTVADVEAIVAANAHYVPTLIDRMSTIQQIEDIVSNRRAEVGSAREAAIESTRVHGIAHSMRDAHQAELDALAAAEAELEAAKKADPEAWSAIAADRRDATQRAMNH
jgi:hypothetical protein